MRERGRGQPVLSVRGVWKVYPGGVVANRDVSLDVYRGEVVALLGENGAGKTTLVSMVAGLSRPTRGRILVGGRELARWSPREAMRRGVALVPQHPMLVEEMTVAENVAMTLRLAGLPASLSEARRLVEELGARYGFEVDPDAEVWRLSFGERQRVEVVRAVAVGRSLVMFDEPTTHMSPVEADRFLALLGRLAAEGRGVILITHRLEEALKAADRIVVMRRGRIVDEVPRGEADLGRLLRSMFGEGVSEVQLKHEAGCGPAGEVLLEARELWVRGLHGVFAVRGVSLRVAAGEVVGVAGVAGNGQRELFEALVGLRRVERGRILLLGEDVTGSPPSRRLAKGMAVVPEERLGWGLVPGKSIVFNVAFALLSSGGTARVTRGPLVDWRAARRLAEEVVEKMQVSAKGVEAAVDSLSGGNMQRLVLGRELAKNPRVLLTMNPTAGLDYASASYVRGLIASLCRRGAGALVFSEDLEELAGISTRILVMYKGRVVYEAERPFDMRAVAEAMTRGAAE